MCDQFLQIVSTLSKMNYLSQLHVTEFVVRAKKISHRSDDWKMRLLSLKPFRWRFTPYILDDRRKIKKSIDWYTLSMWFIIIIISSLLLLLNSDETFFQPCVFGWWKDIRFFKKVNPFSVLNDIDTPPTLRFSNCVNEGSILDHLFQSLRF